MKRRGCQIENAPPNTKSKPIGKLSSSHDEDDEKSVLSSGRRRTKKIRNIPFLFIFFHLFFKNDIRSGCNQRVEWSHAAKMTMVFAVQEKAPTKGVGQNGRTKKTDFKYENADFKR